MHFLPRHLLVDSLKKHFFYNDDNNTNDTVIEKY